MCKLVFVILFIGLIAQTWCQSTTRCTEAQKDAIRHVNQEMLSIFRKGKEQFEWFGSGDYGFAINHSPEGKHQLDFHLVLFDEARENNQLYVKGIIRPVDLEKIKVNKVERSKGSGAFPETEKLKDDFHECGCDELGYIIPQSFGGNGNRANIFIQNGQLNRAIWNAVCNEIKQHLTTGLATDERTVSMELAFVYGDSTHPRRPSLYYYRFGFSDKTGLLYTTLGFLENESHHYAELKSCRAGRNERSGINDKYKYNYVDVSNSKYHDRKSCHVNPNRPIQYGPKITSPTDPAYNYQNNLNVNPN